MGAHINLLKCINFQKPPSYKNEALLRYHKLTNVNIKPTEALVILTSASKTHRHPPQSRRRTLLFLPQPLWKALLHVLLSFSLNETIMARLTLERDGINQTCLPPAQTSMAFLTWVIRKRRVERQQVVQFQDGGTNPPLS